MPIIIPIVGGSDIYFPVDGLAHSSATVNRTFESGPDEALSVNGFHLYDSDGSIIIGISMGPGQEAQFESNDSFSVQETALGQQNGSFRVNADTVWTMHESFTVGTILTDEARTSFQVRTGEGFMILADLIQSALEGGPVAGFYPPQDINVRVRVNGVQVAITAFDWDQPEDRLGGTLNVTLADPDRNKAPIGATVDMAFVVTNSLGVETEIPMLENTKLAGREYVIQWKGQGPGDEVTFTCVDIMEDRFGLAPRRNITMFDPTWVPMHDLIVTPKEAVRDEKGNPIFPILEPIYGLTMMQVLVRAYTGVSGGSLMSHLSPSVTALMARVAHLIGGGGESYTTLGLGFNSVITNIPNYQITRADFTIQGGWHDGAQPFVGMFGPLYFVKNNILFVLDAERKLPTGFTPRTIPIAEYTIMGQSTPYRDPYNAVLLTYQMHENEYPNAVLRPYFTQDTQKSGTYGQGDYTETITTLQGQKLEDFDTGEVIDDFLDTQTIETRITVGSEVGTQVLTAHRETTENFYQLGLKTGHHKEVHGLISTGPNASLEPQLILVEDCAITWVDDPNQIGRKIQTNVVTQIAGMVYTSTEITQSTLNPISGVKSDTLVMFPIAVAQKSGIVTDDGTLGFRPLKTITETLRAVNSSVTDVQIVEMDLLNGTVNRSTTQPRAGQSWLNQYVNRSKTRLLRNVPSEEIIGPRIPVALNCMELPFFWAMELGHRLLARGENPPDVYRLTLPGVDFSADRGSVLRGVRRDGTITPSILIRGRRTSGVNLGHLGHRIQMTLNGVQVPS